MTAASATRRAEECHSENGLGLPLTVSWGSLVTPGFPDMLNGFLAHSGLEDPAGGPVKIARSPRPGP